MEANNMNTREKKDFRKLPYAPTYRQPRTGWGFVAR